MALPPRYVPTLTEVVLPHSMPAQPQQQTAMPQPERYPAPYSHPVQPLLNQLDSNTVVQAVIEQLTPQMHMHLRNSANDLLEMHLREVLPALQMSLEAEVRRSVEAALARRAGDNLG